MKLDVAESGGKRTIEWGSDAVAEVLRRLDIEFICVNPGSSFRGLHDSLVNYLGNDKPGLLLALHEQSVVAIAHGYAKVARKPMAVVLHSNVGLMAGMMSIFNAWCDRVPILILGATGAVDAHVRRNWIDWNHTFRDQGALVRHFVKWDDQPASPQATVESVLRAHQLACTAPRGPAYIVLDRRLQEDALAGGIVIPDVRRFAPAPDGLPGEDAVAQAAAWLHAAKRPVIMIGRVSPNRPDWDARVRLAEVLGARVVTDLRTGASFPTGHPLHGGPADLFLSPANRAIIGEADAVLSLDWQDLADCLLQAQGRAGAAKVIHVSVDAQAHNGFSGDHQRLAAVDLNIAAVPDSIVGPLTKQLEQVHGRRPAALPAAKSGNAETSDLGRDVSTLADIGRVLSALRTSRRFCLVRVPLNWPAGSYQFHEPLDYLGYDGGGGVGSGPGMAVGSAIALRGTGRIPIAIIGDGEFLGAASTLWTAAHYQIPVLFVIANNRSYFTDEIQQETVAKERNRPVQNRWIGQRLDDPPVDLAGLARDFGVAADGPVTEAKDLAAAVRRGIEAVEAGKPYLVDVLIDPTRGASFDWLADA